jgi:hypothetical protein
MAKARYHLFIIVAIAILYFAPNIRSGGVLIPLDLLYHLGPYSASIPPELSSVKNPQLSDLVTMVYPWMEFFRAAEEPLPLWNPYSFCGSPLIGSAQTGLLFPLSWIYRLLPIGIASLCVAIGKLVLCGVFAYLFYRRVGLHPAASLLGGVILMLSGKVVMWLGYPGAFAICTMPFLFWTLEGFICLQRRVDAAWVAVGFGLLFLGSQPQFGFVIGLAGGIYFLFRARAGKRTLPGLYLMFAAAALLGFLIASPQILPFQEYLRESAAYRLRGSFGWKHYPWFTLVSWIFPRFFGDWREGIFWGFSSFIGESVYIGGIALLFSCVGLFTSKRAPSHTGILAVFGFGLLGLYVIPVQRLYQGIPLLGNVDNDKLTVLVVFGLCYFAAVGLDRLVNAHGSAWAVYRAWHWASLLWIILAVAVAIYFRDAVRDLSLQRFEIREAAIHLAFLIFASVLLFAGGKTRITSVGAGYMMVLLAAAELFRVWTGYYPSYPAKYLLPHSTSVDFLRQNAAGSRIFGLDGFIPPETSILFGLQDVRGLEGLTPYRYYRILDKIDPGAHDLLSRLRAMAPAAGRWSPGKLFIESLDHYLNATDPKLISALQKLDYWSNDISRIDHPGILSILGVRFLIAPVGNSIPERAGFRLAHSSDAQVWQNPSCLPRAFVAIHPVFAEGDEAALQAISAGDFEFQRRAVITLNKESDFRGSQTGGLPPRLIPAEIEEYSPHSVKITAESPGEGWLVLSDLYYPGWRATVDGSAAEIYPGNYMCRAVRLTQGKHTVVFHYFPWTFYLGVCLAAAALIVIIAVMVSGGREGRTPPR